MIGVLMLAYAPALILALLVLIGVAAFEAWQRRRENGKGRK